jgi:hypothetical protein
MIVRKLPDHALGVGKVPVCETFREGEDVPYLLSSVFFVVTLHQRAGIEEVLRHINTHRARR